MGAVITEQAEQTELDILRQKVTLSLVLWRALLEAVDVAGMGAMVGQDVRAELARVEAL
jgi:hypothetical protein